MDIGSSEAKPFWTAFLRKLTRRGLRGVKLVISDAHEGIKAAVSKLLCATWQRCRVHFMLNALAHAGKSGRREVVGIFPNEATITRLVGAIRMEQSNEWAVQRARYMTLETMAPLSDNPIIMLSAVPGT